MEEYQRPRTTVLIAIVLGALSSLANHAQAEDLKLVVAPRSVVLTADGIVAFDVYLYNSGDKRRIAPAPEALFDVVWTLRDPDKRRPERSGSDPGIGTDTAKEHVVKPRETVASVLTAHFESEPGDLLEFYVSVDVKSKNADEKPLRSNSVVLYRPKDNESASSPKSAITPQGKN